MRIFKKGEVAVLGCRTFFGVAPKDYELFDEKSVKEASYLFDLQPSDLDTISQYLSSAKRTCGDFSEMSDCAIRLYFCEISTLYKGGFCTFGITSTGYLKLGDKYFELDKRILAILRPYIPDYYLCQPIWR
jgi:hypothetical protein